MLATSAIASRVKKNSETEENEWPNRMSRFTRAITQRACARASLVLPRLAGYKRAAVNCLLNQSDQDVGLMSDELVQSITIDVTNLLATITVVELGAKLCSNNKVLLIVRETNDHLDQSLNHSKHSSKFCSNL